MDARPHDAKAPGILADYYKQSGPDAPATTFDPHA